jgi:hypothetical protein
MAWLILVIVVIAAIAVVAWIWMRGRRTKELQQRFGSEYDRTVRATGDTSAAEAELRQRASRRDSFDIRPLSPESQRAYAERWRGVQSRFVDAPADAIGEADALIGEAMRERGYPVENFDQRAADLSVDHPDVVDHYRAAHRIAAGGANQADTESLRQAMVHYRALFERLIGAGEPAMEARP